MQIQIDICQMECAIGILFVHLLCKEYFTYVNTWHADCSPAHGKATGGRFHASNSVFTFALLCISLFWQKHIFRYGPTLSHTVFMLDMFTPQTVVLQYQVPFVVWQQHPTLFRSMTKFYSFTWKSDTCITMCLMHLTCLFKAELTLRVRVQEVTSWLWNEDGKSCRTAQ